MKKIIAQVSILSLLVPVVGGTVTSVSAEVNETNNTTNEVMSEVDYYKSLGYTVYQFNSYKDFENHINRDGDYAEDTEIRPYAVVSGGVVFVAGVAVGYLIDGVVINFSGQSIGQWVSDGINGIIGWFN